MGWAEMGGWSRPPPLPHTARGPMTLRTHEPNKHWHSVAGQAVLQAVNHACTFLQWHLTQDTFPTKKVQQVCTPHTTSPLLPSQTPTASTPGTNTQPLLVIFEHEEALNCNPPPWHSFFFPPSSLPSPVSSSFWAHKS